MVLTLWRRLNVWLIWPGWRCQNQHIDPAVTSQQKAALDILEETTKFFEARLRADEGHDAAHYLKQRGLDAATVKNFRLGYAQSGLQAAG